MILKVPSNMILQLLAAANPTNMKYLTLGAISALPTHLAFQYSRFSISCPELEFVIVFTDTERKETTTTYLTTIKLKLNFKPELSLWVTMWKKK